MLRGCAPSPACGGGWGGGGRGILGARVRREISPTRRALASAATSPASGRGKNSAVPLLRREAFEHFRILDVELEPAGHHDVAGFRAGFTSPQPLRLDRGRGVTRQRGRAAL